MKTDLEGKGGEKKVIPIKLKEESVYTHFTARLRFMVGVLNIIDLIAIAPFYVELLVRAANPDRATGVPNWLRVFRLVRVVRLLKLSKYSEGLQVQIYM